MDDEELLKEKLIKKKVLKAKVVRNIALTVICIALGVIVSFEYKSIVQQKENEQKSASTLTEAQDRIIELSAEAEALRQSKEEAEKKLEILDNGTNEEKIEKLQEENDLLKKFAGLTDVYGQGIVITLNYADANDVSVSISASLIQSLINELKASSAQAISINGERVLAMTEVRAVNNYLAVNGISLYAPYTISVIGSPTSLESSLGVSIKPKFDSFFSTYGGSFEVKYENNIQISGYSEELVENKTNMMFDVKKSN
ncbi:MAG: DUF881 domain-containing protein [Clostridia bacterium]|nr:DUF881 domain-containing protein [Clostridia bacterium]